MRASPAPMRVLTLRPPWGEAMTRGDDKTGKRTENRRVNTHYRGDVALHSGRTPDWDAPPRAWAAAGLAPPRELGITQKAWTETYVTGTIISVAELTGCHSHLACVGVGACSPWAVTSPGTWHWEFERVRPLPQPLPWAGRLGLLPIGDAAGNAIRAQLADLP